MGLKCALHLLEFSVLSHGAVATLPTNLPFAPLRSHWHPAVDTAKQRVQDTPIFNLRGFDSDGYGRSVESSSKIRPWGAMKIRAFWRAMSQYRQRPNDPDHFIDL
jgi:hypothetical protein